MDDWAKIGVSAAVTGVVAGVVSAVALGALARVEGKGVLQPNNATSHWLHGDEAAEHDEADISHAVVGQLTHQASAMLWALVLEAWHAVRPPRHAGDLVCDASAVSAIAAGVDYGVVPRRLTPGWELVLSKGSLAATYGALALGLAAGSLVSQRVRERL